MLTVEFLRADPPYMTGEVAGFDPAAAHRLVARGVARLAPAAPAAADHAELAPAAEAETAADEVEPAPAAEAGAAGAQVEAASVDAQDDQAAAARRARRR